jgi:hypothetical protein
VPHFDSCTHLRRPAAGFLPKDQLSGAALRRNASCQANVLLVGDDSRSAWTAINTIGGYVGLAFTVVVLILIVRR